MKDLIEKLRKNEKHWVTDMGAWFPGERVVMRGRDLFKELADLNFAEIIYFAATGKIYSEKEMKFLDHINTISSSYPDPRLWNNRVAALAGTTRSTPALGIAAGTATTEAKTYGGRALVRAYDFMRRGMQQIQTGVALEEVVEKEIKKYRTLAGYGRPVTAVDERIQPILRLAKESGFGESPSVQFALEIEKYLQKTRRRIRLNASGAIAAVVVSWGMEPKDYEMMVLMAFTAGIIASYVDARQHGEGAFFPFSVERINYSGEAIRVW